MDHWDEIRTAYFVARAGTVSGAAEALGIHHATVIRHVDALEERMGVKLFQRHARGYTPTEAGADLARVAQTTEDQLSQLGGRLRGQGGAVSGELIVTTLPVFAPRMAATLADFQREHPKLTVRLETGTRLFRLEYGEAHVAVRAGPTPNEPDNVVQHFFDLETGLYASQDYVDRHGMPTLDNLPEHKFISLSGPSMRAPFMVWLKERVPEEAFSFQTPHDQSVHTAIASGAGVGFMCPKYAQDLVEVSPPREEWAIKAWLVTHVDLHRTAKVQATLTHLKEAARDWAARDESVTLP